MKKAYLILSLMPLLFTGCASFFAFLGYSPTPGSNTNFLPDLGVITGSSIPAGILFIANHFMRNYMSAKKFEVVNEKIETVASAVGVPTDVLTVPTKS